MKSLTLCSLLFIATTLNAQTWSCGSGVSASLADSTLTITGSGAMTNFTSASAVPWDSSRNSIKRVIVNVGVTSVGNYAFYSCVSLISVSISNGLTSIGNYAFANCSALPSLVIPNSVTSIGEGAFSYCSALPSMTIPTSITSIGKYAFENCAKLKKLTVADTTSVLKLGSDNGPFTSSSIDTVYIGRPVRRNISWSSFPLFGAGVKHLTISNNVDTLDNYAFSGCYGLTSAIIPDNVTYIGNSAFRGCSALTSITIPDHITTIEDYTFFGCSALTSVPIRNTTTYIGKYAFAGCSALPFVIIPDGITSIEDGAFAGCRALTSLTIQSTITSIGQRAFDSCTGLRKLVIADAANALLLKDSAYSPSDHRGPFQNCKIDTVYMGRNVNRDSNTVWALFGNGIKYLTIGNTITTINNAAFSGNSSLISAVIPNSVTSIGSHAFAGCSALTSVNIPDGLTIIEKGTFAGCRALPAIAVPNSVTVVGDSALAYCQALTSITIPDGVTTIGRYAFYYCLMLSSFDMPNSVTFIGDNAFNSCARLTSVTIPTGLTAIEDYTFAYCGLTSVVIPDNVTSIGERAFYYCTSLTSVVIPESVTSIGAFAFGDCSMLTAVTIPYSVTSIGRRAFYNARDLKKLVIADAASALMLSFDQSSSTGPFSNCAIDTVYVGRLVDRDGNNSTWALFGTAIQHLTIGNSVDTIRDYAFSGCNALRYILALRPEPPIIGANTFNYVSSYCCLFVMPDSFEAYSTADYWKNFGCIQVEGTNCYLKALSVSKGWMSPMFDTAVTSYSVTLAYMDSTITISAIPDDARATVTGTGEKDLTVGVNPCDIVVTAKDGITTKTYTINVTRFALPTEPTEPEDSTTGIKDVETWRAASLQTWTQNGVLHIKGLTIGETYRIYAISGTMVYQAIATADVETWCTMPMPRGVYIIRSKTKSAKLVW